jgi:pyridoxal phosphate enzyme (YggS family)
VRGIDDAMQSDWRYVRIGPIENSEHSEITSEGIAERLHAVRERVAAAERRAGRAPGCVRIVLAAKTQTPAAIRAAYQAGARDFGENYVREAIAKRAALADLVGIRWHMIGHLQTNKARIAAENFDLIHSLDSERLAIQIARARPMPKVPMLVEVNLGGEATKTGIAADRVEALIDAARNLVDITGLMTIPPEVSVAEDARPYFARMRELRDRLAARTGLALSELSMGMTGDFEVAIEEGATMVRIGRAIFGERQR